MKPYKNLLSRTKTPSQEIQELSQDRMSWQMMRLRLKKKTETFTMLSAPEKRLIGKAMSLGGQRKKKVTGEILKKLELEEVVYMGITTTQG